MNDIPECDFSRALRGDQLQRLRHGQFQGGDLAALRRMLAADADTFAAAIGVTKDVLLEIENGTTRPDASQRNLIAVIARHPRIITKHELPLASA